MCTTRSSKSGKHPALSHGAFHAKTAVVLCLAWLAQACFTMAPTSTAAPPPSTGAPPVSRAATAEALGLGLSELTVQDIRAAYAGGEFTAVELTRAFLARIDQYESHYNALISMNPDALATAAALDEEYAARGPRGPLHGVPVVIKDNLDFGGLVTTAGFSGFSALTGGIDMIPQNDATVVARLREAGAIVLGKTNLPDFAGDGTRTRSPVAGVTLNPYNLHKHPGGSSGRQAPAVTPRPAAPRPGSFGEVVELFAANREAVLQGHRLSAVHLVRFEPGRIEFRPGAHAPRDLANRMGELLSRWTQVRWVVSVSAETGAPSLAEQAEGARRKRRNEAARHPLVRAALETFPGAKITDVRDIAPPTDAAPGDRAVALRPPARAAG